MDVLYVIGTGSKWRNNELRYSLRSVEKHLKGYNRIFIVGDVPDFVSNCHVYILPDRTEAGINYRHEYNIYNKIVCAIKYTDIDDNFLFINDDHFFIQDVDVKKYPFYMKCSLQESIEARETDDYQIALKNTQDALERTKKSTNNFDTHTPIIYNSSKFLELNKYDWENKDFVIKSLYCNTHGIIGTFQSDCKINYRCSESKIKELIQNRDVFSVGDNALRQGVHHYQKSPMRLFLKHTFPNPSKYEQ